jgi:N-acyl-D-amino-acid deacylase
MRTLIKNGFVIDGTGRPGFSGCVAIEADMIADVFEGDAPVSAAESFDRVVDAAGLSVSPGFIDSHSHSDAYLVIEPDAPSKLSQGITTEINGQCGGSIAPRYGEARLSGDWASILGERLTWRSLSEYRDVLSAARPSVSWCALHTEGLTAVSHSLSPHTFRKPQLLFLHLCWLAT